MYIIYKQIYKLKKYNYVGAIRTLISEYQKFMTYLLVNNIFILINKNSIE